MVLTRLLFPEVFGVMALVTVILSGMSLLSDVGLDASVIQNDNGGKHSFLITVWTVKAIRGAVLCLVALCLAWPASVVYSQPVLLPLICFCSIKLLLDGFQSVALLHSKREMNLKLFVFLQISVQIVGFIVTIGFAYYFENVWALAVGSVTSSLVHLLLSHYLFNFKHSFFIDKAALSEIIFFGKWLLLATVLTFLGGQGLRGIEGFLVDVETIGFIFIAGMLSAFVSDGYQRMANQVIFPYFSILNRSKESQITDHFYKIRVASIVPALIALLVISNFSKEIIELLYDPRYLVTGVYLKFIAINAAIGLMPRLYMDALISTGNSKTHFSYMALHTGLLIVGTLLGFSLAGVLGMLIGQGCASLLGYCYALFLARKTVDIPYAFDIICLLVILVNLVFIIHLNLSALRLS
jgi:O-antigen/teichoic acid export membrane protein